MGNMILAATSTKSSGTSLLPIIIIVVLFMLVYMTMTRRSRARRAQQTQSTLVPGTRVRTSSGIYGTITSVEGNDDVMLEVAPGVHVRVMARAVVPLPPDASMGEAPPEEPEYETADAEDEADHDDTVSHASTNGSVHASTDADANGQADTGETQVVDRDPQDRNV
jgi:preprotein translocase subunit YajC